MKRYIFFILILSTQCTWTPRSVLPEYFRTIYIPTFENKTLQPDIDIALTRKVKTEFEIDARLTVTEYVSLADGILLCDIIKYKKVPVTYTEAGEIDTTTLIIGVRLELKDIKSTEIIHNGYIEEEINYNLKSEPVETEIIAQERLIDELARRIVSKTIEGW